MKETDEVRKQRAWAIMKEWANQGRVLEGGWQSFAYMLGLTKAGVSEVQRKEMKKAFYAGAQHLYATMMVALDPGEQETEADLKRVEMIDAELRQFVEEVNAQGGN